MKIIGTSFKRSHAGTGILSAPNHAAGHCQPTPPSWTPGLSWGSLGQSPVGSLLLSPGSWCTQASVYALQESVSPALCMFWWLYGGVNSHLFYEGLFHPQVYWTQISCHCISQLLTCTSTGDTQTQFCLSLCGVFRSWSTQDMFEPSEHLWWVWGLMLNAILPLSYILDVGCLLKVAPALYSNHASAAQLLMASPWPFLSPAGRSGNFQYIYCWSISWRILSITLLTCKHLIVFNFIQNNFVKLYCDSCHISVH